MKRDCGEELIIEDLSWHYHNFMERLEFKKTGSWSFDWKEEKKELKKMTKALKRVLDFYGEKV